jgi:putative PEP-CTERM system TPR-repeat lipoprotein
MTAESYASGRRRTFRAAGLVGALASVMTLLAACSPTGEELYQRAEQAMDEGRYRAALIDLKNLVQAEPGNAKARAALAIALLEEGDAGGAQVEAEKAKQSGAEPSVWLLASCRVQIGRGEFDQALKDCKPDAVPEKQRPAMNVAIGNAYLATNRIGEAKAAYQAALAVRPDNLGAVVGMASAVQVAEGVDAARKLLESAPASVQGKTRYWLARGAFESRWGEPAAAEAAYRKAIDNLGKDAGSGDELAARAGLVQALVQQNKAKEATESAEELMSRASKNPVAKYVRAQAALISDDLQLARSLLEEVVSDVPGNMQARMMLGLVNLKQGNLGQAELHLAEVVGRDPGNWYARRLLAETRVQQKEPEAALRVLQGQPGEEANPALLSLAGRLSLGTGNKAEGLALLEQAAAAKSGDPRVVMELASGYLVAGEVDKAIDLIKSLPESDTQGGYQREYLLMLALVSKGQNEAALDRARELSRTRGYDPTIRNLVAGLYASLGKPDEARAELEAALKSDPNDVATYLNLARLDASQGKTDAAEANLRTVLEKDPQNLTATLAMSGVAATKRDTKEMQRWLDKANADHPASPIAKLALAQFYLQSGDSAKARAVADEAAKLAPDNSAVAATQGLAAMSARDGEAAISSFERAVQLAPGNMQNRLNLARAYSLAQDPDKAQATLDEALQREPDNFMVLTRAATTALAAGKFDAGQQYVDRMVKLQPESPVTLAVQGDLAMRAGEFSKALDFYQRAATRAPSGLLAITQFVAGQRAGVANPEKPVVDWLQAHPSDVMARLALGEYKQAGGDFGGAVKEYEAALATQPENGAILNNLAYVYLETGDARALATAERAYAKLPDSPAIQDTYGWALVQAGQPEKALGPLRTAASALPGNPEVQLHLGEALIATKQFPEAERVLKGLQGPKVPPPIAARATELLERKTR